VHSSGELVLCDAVVLPQVDEGEPLSPVKADLLHVIPQALSGDSADLSEKPAHGQRVLFTLFSEHGPPAKYAP